MRSDFPYLELLTSEPYFWLGVLSVLLLLGFWIMVRHQPKAIVAFEDQNGQVSVSRNAICGLVQKICDSYEEVGKSHTRIHARGRTLRIRVKVKMQFGSNLKTVSVNLEKNIERVLREDIGMRKKIKVDLVIDGFIGVASRDFSAEAAPEESEPS